MVSTHNSSRTLQPFNMSAIQMIIANIQILSEAERAQVLSHFAAAPKDAGAGVAKDLEPKKKNANKGRPTCHGDFVKKVLAEQKEAVLAFKEANKEVKGAHLVFVANYKKENTGEFAIFEAAWKEAHPKPKVAPSVASDSEPLAEADEVIMPNEKPKRVISEEQKAKMKAGREAAVTAKKLAEKEAAQIAVAMAAELMGHGEVPEAVAAPVLKKRGPNKLEDMTPEELAKREAKKAERKAKKAADALAGNTDTGSEVSASSIPSGRSASPKQKAE